MEPALERVVVRIRLRLVVVLEKINEYVEHVPSADALVQTSREAGYLSLELQLEQCGGYRFHGQAAARDKLVDVTRVEPHLLEQIVAGARFPGFFLGAGGDAQLLEHVPGAFHELRTLLDK